MLSAIVCMDNFGGIGKDGKLLYHISEDMERFKKITMGHTIIMGRKTWNSIGNRPLEGRENIVISKTLNYSYEDEKNDTQVTVIHDISEEDIRLWATLKEEVFVIGGESIYKMFFPYCEKVYATIVNNKKYEADTFFPIKELLHRFKAMDFRSDKRDWKTGITFSFITYVKSNQAYLEDAKNTSKAYSDPVAGHDAVENPSHYTSGKYGAIEFIEDRGFSFCLGNVAKYICRAGKKYPGDKQKELQDLKKAMWYLDRRIQEEHDGFWYDSEENPQLNIDLDDFIKDQKLSYIRGKIITLISEWDAGTIERNLYSAKELLDAEIHRMEEEVL